MMSKNAWSPGRIIRSEKTCGCGLHRSPAIELIASTNSEPISYSRLWASPTTSLSRTPGLRNSKMSWYTPSTIAQAWVSSVISSWLLISRASIITCCPSRTSSPARWSSRNTVVSATSTPSGMSARPSSLSTERSSSAARRWSPTAGEIAPCRPVLPPTEFVSSYHCGSCSRCAFAADPKSQMRGGPVRVISA